MCLCVSFALLQHVRRQTCENRRMLGCKTPPEREVGEITQPYLHLFGQVFSHLPSHLASPTMSLTHSPCQGLHPGLEGPMPDDDPREASADVSGRTCGTKEEEGVMSVSGNGGA